jgi:hypothetical protein
VEIRFGELTDGTLVLLWVEAEETWAVRLDELADWIHSSCSLVSYQPTGQ